MPGVEPAAPWPSRRGPDRGAAGPYPGAHARSSDPSRSRPRVGLRGVNTPRQTRTATHPGLPARDASVDRLRRTRFPRNLASERGRLARPARSDSSGDICEWRPGPVPSPQQPLERRVRVDLETLYGPPPDPPVEERTASLRESMRHTSGSPVGSRAHCGGGFARSMAAGSACAPSRSQTCTERRGSDSGRSPCRRKRSMTTCVAGGRATHRLLPCLDVDSAGLDLRRDRVPRLGATTEPARPGTSRSELSRIPGSTERWSTTRSRSVSGLLC